MRLILSFVIFSMVLVSCEAVEHLGNISGVPSEFRSLTRVASSASKAMRPISDEEEYYVGRAVGANLFGRYKIYRNLDIYNYVNQVGIAVALHSDKPVTFGGYHFAVLDTDEINAFACPGGTILITKGMLNTVNSEDELAGVLAHEVAHINARDGISSIKSARWTEALTVLGSEAAHRYAPSEVSKLVNIFEGSIDDIVKTLVVNGYSRSQEYDADKNALIYMSRAGYNPNALKTFLQKLEKINRTSSGIAKTHPGTADRISNVSENMPKNLSNPAYVNYRTSRFNQIVNR